MLGLRHSDFFSKYNKKILTNLQRSENYNRNTQAYPNTCITETIIKLDQSETFQLQNKILKITQFQMDSSH